MKLFLQKFVVFVGLIAVCFIPTWLFLFLRWSVQPQGFWHNFATGVLGIAALGGIQVFLFIAFVYFSLMLWTTKGPVF